MFGITRKRLVVAGTTAALLAMVVVAIIASAQVVVGRHTDAVHDTVEAVPPRRVALVLGCSPTVCGRPNLYFRYRVAAAAELYHAGKVRDLLVSGDNSRRDYDEPTAMREALVAEGIPAERIHRDYAGFSTLDSVIRAKEVFGVTELVVVSQRFHVERAIYLARSHGIDAVGYAAPDVRGVLARRVRLREYLARVKALLDLTFGREPRFYGPDPYGLGS